MCDNAYTPLNFFTLPEIFFVNLYQDAEQVLVLVISQLSRTKTLDSLDPSPNVTYLN